MIESSPRASHGHAAEYEQAATRDRGSYRDCRDHCSGPSSAKVAMMAYPPTFKARSRRTTYAAQSSSSVRKWNAARSCQMSSDLRRSKPIVSVESDRARAENVGDVKPRRARTDYLIKSSGD